KANTCMSSSHALKLSGGLLNDWLSSDARGLCFVNGSSDHVTAFLAELCAHWLPPRLISANQQRSSATVSSRVHWAATLTSEEAARSALQKFGARRDASTYSSVHEILLANDGDGDERSSLDRLLEHLAQQYETLTAVEGGRPILVLEDISPLVYLGHSPSEVTHAILRLCQRTRIGRSDSAGLFVIGCHSASSDVQLRTLSSALMSLAIFVINAEPLETGYLPEVDGRVTLTAPALISNNGESSCHGNWRSAAYHYLVSDRQVKCFPIGLSDFAAG
ncbi:hypothetical protein BOX15_Mlig008054g4, partial [Macrostomum lignano]